jgi:ubiquitin C-terminal hydrolase
MEFQIQYATTFYKLHAIIAFYGKDRKVHYKSFIKMQDWICFDCNIIYPICYDEIVKICQQRVVFFFYQHFQV